MEERLRGVTWEALEHNHGEKSSDWFWVLAVITVTATVAAILFGNVLLGILFGLSGTIISLLAVREARIISYAITQRGLRIDDRLYPFSTLETYHIDEDQAFGPQLLVKSEKMFMPLLILPLPAEYLEEIEDILADHLPQEMLEEPFANKLLEFFGF